MKQKLLRYIRKHVGSYCTDEYWLSTIDMCYLCGHAIKRLHDNLSYWAMNAIATDMHKGV